MTIRVALIGLSASAKTSWAEDGHLPYLHSPQGRAHYTITALLNSSIEAGEAAKAHFNLPASVKTYGDPGALAADPDVDLVVCNTRVDVHHRTVAPSLAVGKAAYIEWPLAESLQASRSLVPAANPNDSLVGLQGRLSPIVQNLRKLLLSGVIGRVLSSDIRAFESLLPRDVLPKGLAYFADRQVGGNPVSIAYAHMIDYVHFVLGEFNSFEGRMQVQRPRVKIEGTSEMIVSDVPDLVTVHGQLDPTTTAIDVVEDAILSVTFRSGPPFKDAPAFEWTINGEIGELKIVGPEGPYWNIPSDSYSDPIRIQVHLFETDDVHDIPWDWEAWQKELPSRARLVAAVYEQYATWVKSGRPVERSEKLIWPRVQDAIIRHEEITRLFAQYDGKQRQHNGNA